MPRHLLHLSCGLLALAALGCAGAGGGASFVPPSRPAELSLAGIPWGISADSVTTLIGARGYNLNRADREGDLWFDGMVRRTPTRVYAFMSEKKLVKFRSVILAPDEKTMSTYRATRAELIRLYGEPKETVEEYLEPYTKGDSLAMKAVSERKAVIHTDWLPSGSRTNHVSVEIQNVPPIAVIVDYESAAWNRESLRRRQGR